MGTPKQVKDAGDKALEELKAMDGKTEEAPVIEPEVIEPTPVETPKPEHTETIESIQHKYDVLQGKYNKEVRELKEDIGILNRQKHEISSLRKSVDEQTKRNVELATLLGDVQKQITKPKEEKAEVLDFIPSEYLSGDELKTLEDEDLTPSTLKLIAKMIHGIAKKAQVAPVDTSAELKTELKDIKDRLAKTDAEQEQERKDRAKKAESTFMQRVEEGVTGKTGDEATVAFDKLNHDPEFLKWLNQKAPYSDKTIKAALNDAGGRQDVEGVVRIFTDYKLSIKSPEPKKDPLLNELEPKPRTDGSIPKDTSATDAALVKKWGTPEAIRKFSNECASGKYRGKDAERAKIEAEIWRANQIILKK